MLAVSRTTLIPIAVACVLLVATYGLGLALGWSAGAMGVGVVLACVTTAVVRAMLAHPAKRGPAPGP